MQLFAGFIGGRGFVFRADASGDVGVQIFARQHRRMAVDMAAFERLKFRHDPLVLVDHARVVHDLGQPNHRRVVAQRDQVRRLYPRARGFHVG